jgi:hypothetical protein
MIAISESITFVDDGVAALGEDQRDQRSVTVAACYAPFQYYILSTS